MAQESNLKLYRQVQLETRADRLEAIIKEANQQLEKLNDEVKALWIKAGWIVIDEQGNCKFTRGKRELTPELASEFHKLGHQGDFILWDESEAHLKILNDVLSGLWELNPDSYQFARCDFCDSPVQRIHTEGNVSRCDNCEIADSPTVSVVQLG